MGCAMAVLAACGGGPDGPMNDAGMASDAQGDGAAADAFVPEGSVPVVVALGHRGRTLVTC